MSRSTSATGPSADRHTSFLEVRSCPESGLNQHRLPLRTLLRTPFALPSHTPNTPGRYEKRPVRRHRVGFERSLDLDVGELRKGGPYSDVTYRVLITASRGASHRSGSLARIETKGGRDGYPGCPLNGRRRRHSTRECYPLALVYFPAEAIGRAKSGFGSAAGGPKSVMLPAPK
jgi:hypothetical protein